jgi:hypothetical protein
MFDTARQRNLPTIEPFWQRIPRFFAYGLHWRTLTLAACLALLNIFLLKGLFVIVLYAVTMRYAMAALEHTAAGELTPPPFGSETLFQGYELPFKLFVILVMYFALLAWVAANFGVFLAGTLYVIGSLMFPALIMMLVLSESLMTALNPLTWFSLAHAIGWPYLALFGMWFAVGMAQETASSWLLGGLPIQLVVPFWLAVNTVFSVIGFHMMGYVLLQYHREIGDPLATETRLAAQAPDVALRTPLFEQLLGEGKVDAAAAELMDRVRQRPADLELRRLAHNFLLSHGQDTLLLENARGYMDALLAAGNLGPAAELFSECLKRGQNCQPGSPLHHVALVRRLRAMGHAKDAVKLSNGFHKRYPTSDETPGLYLEVAAVLSEDLQRDDLAKQLLDFVLKHYPQHERAAEVRRYRDMLSRLGDQPV